jgi:hypothetical protein
MVAIGTLALGAATGVLAWRTSDVASKTGHLAASTADVAEETKNLAASSEADLAAQFRPIIAPARFPPSEGQRFERTQHVWGRIDNNGRWQFGITNVGRGPALSIAIHEAGGQTGEIGNRVIAPNAEAEVAVIPVPTTAADSSALITVTYESAAGEQWTSVLRVTPAHGSVLWATELHSVTRA